ELNEKGEYYFWRGVIYQNSGSFQAAKEDYYQAIEKGFENAYLYNNLAICLSEEGRYSEGLQATGRALELNPDYAAAVSARSKLYFFMFRLDEACAEMERAKQMGHQRVLEIPREIC